MSRDGEMPFEVPHERERALFGDLLILEEAAVALVDQQEVEVHRQYVRIDPLTGNSVFFKIHYDEAEHHLGSYAEFGVTVGSLDNVVKHIEYPRNDGRCRIEPDKDVMTPDEVLAVVQSVSAGGNLTTEELAIVRRIAPLIAGESTEADDHHSPLSTPELIRKVTADNTYTDLRIHSFETEEGDIEGFDIGVKVRAADAVEVIIPTEDIQPSIQIEVNDNKNGLTYTYLQYSDTIRELVVQNTYTGRSYEYSNDEIPADAIQKMQNALKEAVELQVTSLDKVIMHEVYQQGPQYLAAEIEKAGSVNLFVTGLLLAYEDSKKLHSFAGIAVARSEYEEGIDFDFSNHMASMTGRGILLGLDMALRVLPNTAAKQLDNVDLFRSYEFDFVDDNATLAKLNMLFFDAKQAFDEAGAFHADFNDWLPKMCPNPEDYIYVKQGFGLVLLAIGKAARLHTIEALEDCNAIKAEAAGYDWEPTFELLLNQNPGEA